MASDNLNQVGKYFKQTRRDSDFAIKRVSKKVPVRDRVRDTVSAVFPFKMTILTDNEESIIIDINFLNPPPSDCEAECIATTCEDFELLPGGHSITVTNPYIEGSVRAYSGGEPLDESQWYEENFSGGQVYVQVPPGSPLTVVCYAYIVC